MSSHYYWNRKLEQRDTGQACPERPQRCSVLDPSEILADNPKMLSKSFSEVDESILSLTHTSEYIEKVKTSFEDKLRSLDSGDTKVTENTYSQALLAASAGIYAADACFNDGVKTSFCAIRPPGHHANKLKALGFCIFNNIAITANYCLSKNYANKVLIIDFDVHPGNGTQEIFYESDEVFVLSIHQDEQFPFAGNSDLQGKGQGLGHNLNVPLKKSTTRTEYLLALESALEQVLKKFSPDLTLISAGFDAHKQDPSRTMNLETEDYFKITRSIIEKTAPLTNGRTISFLEGGYNTSKLRDCVIQHCKALV